MTFISALVHGQPTVSNLRVLLDSPTEAYYAGTEVTGSLVFTLCQPTHIRAMNVEFKGVAHTSFQTEARSGVGKKGSSSTMNSDSDFDATIGNNSPDNGFRPGVQIGNISTNETCFIYIYNLIAGADYPADMPPGTHTCSFRALLPHDIPATFESDHGNITYFVNVTLELPLTFNAQKKKFFTVSPVRDLNCNLQLKVPVMIEKEKNFCCFCCRSGPFAVVVSLPYTGYVPGQNIPISVEVDNSIGAGVEELIATLDQLLIWKAYQDVTSEDNCQRYSRLQGGMRQKRKTTTICSLTLGPVRKNATSISRGFLNIPANTPCTLDQCPIISCTYSLKVVAVMSSVFYRNMEIDVPLVLGTKPINLQSY